MTTTETIGAYLWRLHVAICLLSDDTASRWQLAARSDTRDSISIRLINNIIINLLGLVGVCLYGDNQLRQDDLES